MAGTHGIGVFGINSKFASGSLVFYEKTVGRTATGDVFTVGTAAVKVGGTSQDVDFQFYATGSITAILDAGAKTFTLDDIDISLGDNDELRFGDATGGDVVVKWDATNLTIIPATDNTGVLEVGNDGTKSMDVKFYGATASAYMEWDNSADRLNIVTVSGRAITGEEHAVDIVNGGTVSSGDSMVGLNVKTTASGSAATWVSGLFVNATQASKVVNGYLCAAEFELTSTAANASDNSVIVLNSVRNHTGSPPAADPYVMLREYGTTYGNVFLRIFGDTGQGAITGGASTTLLATGTADKAATCMVRCMFGSTVFWLLGTTNVPT